MSNLVLELKDKVLSGYDISIDEAKLLYHEELEDLLKSANAIRKKICGDRFSLCSIINAKSGRCSEDCKYCAQSSYYATGIKAFPLLKKEEILVNAKIAQKLNIHNFSLVTSGKNLSTADFARVLDIYQTLHHETNLSLCASLGMITYEQALALKEVGVSRYHHNLETCKSYFPKICTTHTYEDNVQTINNVRKARMSICTGGIIGLGENIAERIQLAMEIRGLGVDSVPINILMPISGTPLARAAKLTVTEILKTIAIFRFILPTVELRCAGGRQTLEDRVEDSINGGINAWLTGDYLTTTGSSTAEDIKLIKKNGFSL